MTDAYHTGITAALWLLAALAGIATVLAPILLLAALLTLTSRRLHPLLRLRAWNTTRRLRRTRPPT